MGLPTIAVPEYTLTIPSTGKEIKYRPFLVKEEKILLIALESEDDAEVINAIKNIIQSCIFGDYDVSSMPTFDLEYIFLQLRAKSKGEVIDLKYECPKCKIEIEVHVNTNDVQIQLTKGHTNKIELTEELGVIMKYPTIELQSAVAQFADEKRQIEGIFQMISSSIEMIYDKENTYPVKDHTEEEINTFLESLTDEHFQKISTFFDTMPKLEHKIQVNCTNKVGKGKNKSKCGYKEEQTLSGLQSFFA